MAVRYIEYDKVDTKNTVLEFRGGDENIKVTIFTGEKMERHIVSIVAEKEEDIVNLVESQDKLINCREIEFDKFKELVKDSRQIKNIRRIVKELISKEYDAGDEQGMNRLDNTNPKKIKYEEYVESCKNHGKKLKKEIGYEQ